MHSTEEALESARSSRSDLDIGRFDGLRAALSLLVKQADAFGIPRAKVGIDPQLNLGRDLRLDPPPGYSGLSQNRRPDVCREEVSTQLFADDCVAKMSGFRADRQVR